MDLLGLKARSADDKRAGKVVAVTETGIVLERWFPLPATFFVPFEDVTGVVEGKLRLRRPFGELTLERPDDGEPLDIGPRSQVTSFFETGADDEPRGPTIRVGR